MFELDGAFRSRKILSRTCTFYFHRMDIFRKHLTGIFAKKSVTVNRNGNTTVASVLRPASQVGPMHEAAGMGKLVNSALLSLINEACECIFVYRYRGDTAESCTHVAA